MLMSLQEVHELPELLTELEPAGLPTLLLERGGCILWQNARLTALCGPLVGEQIQESSSLVPDKGAADALQSILTSGDPSDFTVTAADESGVMKTLQFSTIPVAADLSVVAIFGLEAGATPAPA